MRAAAFWPLINGNKDTVIQTARKREIDDQVFKYVVVAGVDKARIVQVGVGARNLCKVGFAPGIYTCRSTGKVLHSSSIVAMNSTLAP